MSERHHCFQIQTVAGVPERIHGDPNMLAETRAALAELIDAAMKSVPRAVATGSETDYSYMQCPRCYEYVVAKYPCSNCNYPEPEKKAA